jgi:hypothetical protein
MSATKQPPMGKILPFQPALRPALPTVLGNVDYEEFSNQLHRIDLILRESGAEELFVQMSMGKFEENLGKAGSKAVSTKVLLTYQKHSYRALRCTLLKSLLGCGYREMSCRLAECPLFRWFCGIEEMGEIRVPGKSTLQRYAEWLEPEPMRTVVDKVFMAANRKTDVGEVPWNLKHEIELETVWMDTTCVKTNIHFPVDWVLLRDATRTLMKATLLIRKHGLKHRMEDPTQFMKRMNRLCILMTRQRRSKDSMKKRKQTLRWMKKLVKKVSGHARRYRQLLDKEWKQTDWSRAQAEQVWRRMDSVLELLPKAQKQAHDRIIGERKIANEDKILSLYEPETRVIVRGKAGSEVEFGNTLFLAEQKDGLIVDWKFHESSAPADCRQICESIEGIETRLDKKISSVGGDRGFDSSENRKYLEGKNIYNGICPKNPKTLQERVKEENFVKIQKRRSQTESRIGIFKNTFLGRPMRSKRFTGRESSIAWNILAHNLWVLARLPRAKKEGLKKAA